MIELTVIYIDVLIILNLYVTFFLIKATSCFLHLKTQNFRIFCGSIIGGISSLVILLPELNALLNVTIKAAIAFLIVLSVFGFGKLQYYLKNTLIFFMINIIFAGIMLLLWFFSAPLGMQFNNGVPYFDISFFTIVISTAISYIILRVFRSVADQRELFEKKYILQIENGGKIAITSAIADTGNSLVDYFSGLPVIIVSADILSGSVSSEILSFKVDDLQHVENLPEKLRVIPYSTINGSGYIAIIKADKLTISDGKNCKCVNALIGISNEEFKNEKAIFNPKILN